MTSLASYAATPAAPVGWSYARTARPGAQRFVSHPAIFLNDARLAECCHLTWARDCVSKPCSFLCALPMPPLHRLHHNNLRTADGRCTGARHLYCFLPPLPALPEDNWYCDFCVEHSFVDGAAFTPAGIG